MKSELRTSNTAKKTLYHIVSGERLHLSRFSCFHSFHTWTNFKSSSLFDWKLSFFCSNLHIFLFLVLFYKFYCRDAVDTQHSCSHCQKSFNRKVGVESVLQKILIIRKETNNPSLRCTVSMCSFRFTAFRKRFPHSSQFWPESTLLNI